MDKMSLAGGSKTSFKHPCDKCVSPGTSNISLDESDTSVRTADINMNANSYENTPSPSSIASTSTINHPFKYRRSNSRNQYHSHLFSKRRHRYDRLFHHTHSLNRQYIITMTNILFQMQKEMYKLKKRTQHVEQMLVKQSQSGHPIIRIPRLTRDDISTICIHDNDNQHNITSVNSEENDRTATTTNEIEPLDIKSKGDAESPVTLEAKGQIDDETNCLEKPQQPFPASKIKYCSKCDKEFSHRSGYLRHMRRIHHRPVSSTFDYDNHSETEASHQEPPSVPDEPPLSLCGTENAGDGDEYQVLINPWDVGEGRLRPRRPSKLTSDPVSKVKCNICHRFFRTNYIKNHRKRAHGVCQTSSSMELNENSPDQIKSPKETPRNETPRNETPRNETETIDDQSPSNHTEPSPTIAIADMDIDDIPIRFRKESNKPIVLATTCLERYQADIVEDFVQKFSSRVSQTSIVDFRTTHLITNDDQNNLRSPLSLKLIEAVAHHCYCVTYRWIIDCLKYDRIIDENSYEIEADCNSESSYPHGGPRRSRLIEKRSSLFDKLCFMIKCSENNDTRIPNDRLQGLIITCGGQIITCVTQDVLENYQIIVLCDRLYVSERRHNYDQCHSLGIKFVSPDWILESIVEYRRKPIKSYEQTPE